MTVRFIAILGAFLTFASCSSAGKDARLPDPLTASEAPFAELPGWGDATPEEQSAALASLRNSCKVMGARPSGEDAPARLRRAADDMAGVCAALPGNGKDAAAFFGSRFCPYKLSSPTPAFFTGYYMPELQISAERTDEYSIPIYGKPVAPWRGAPPSRKDIEEWGALAGISPVIAWARDRVGLFFLHVQGSGAAVYPDGTRKKLAFAGKTGLPYKSIGTILIERGEISKENMNGATLKKWLYDHKEEGETLMRENPSYIFFSIENADAGATGASGATLVPQHSLAVDSRFIPYGLPLWIDTARSPDGNKAAPFRTLAVSQDGGSAIKGPLRADIFFGAGKAAESYAYHQKFPGEIYALLPCE